MVNEHVFGMTGRGESVNVSGMWKWVYGRVWTTMVRKIIDFGQKHLLTLNFYGSTLSPTSPNPDRWVQREVYGGPNLDEKKFQ